MEYWEFHKQPFTKPKKKAVKKAKVLSWQLVWFVNNKEKEVLCYNKPYPLCMSIKKKKKSNYSTGQLKIIPYELSKNVIRS